jgi:hypothetical protein
LCGWTTKLKTLEENRQTIENKKKILTIDASLSARLNLPEAIDFDQSLALPNIQSPQKVFVLD